MLLAAASTFVACDDPSGPPVGELVILTEELASAAVGQLYDQALAAEGGAGGFFWEIVEGRLPPGVALLVDDLTRDEAFLTGVPETAGTFPFTLRVAANDPGDADTVELTLEVLPPPSALRIDNIALPPTVVGGQMALQLRASGGPAEAAWSVASGALPAGLTLTPSGRITGVPADTGTTTVIVQAVSGEERTFRSYTLRVVPDDPSGLQLTLFPVLPIPESVRPHLEAAVERWEEVLTGDLGGGTIPENLFAGDQCGGLGRDTNGVAVDDILVLVDIDSIDGPAQVLGRAGPCGIRQDGLPFIGLLTLDETDLIPLSRSSTLTALITHELGHTLGFGTLWRRSDLIEGAGTEDPRFTGETAVVQWRGLGGVADVPVENEGGEGTVDSHLRESVFNRELMTGFAEAVDVPQPMSAITIAAMGDLGYVVDLTRADAFSLDRPAGVAGPAERPLAWDEVLTEPVPVLADFGRGAPGRSGAR